MVCRGEGRHTDCETLGDLDEGAGSVVWTVVVPFRAGGVGRLELNADGKGSAAREDRCIYFNFSCHSSLTVFPIN